MNLEQAITIVTNFEQAVRDLAFEESVTSGTLKAEDLAREKMLKSRMQLIAALTEQTAL